MIAVRYSTESTNCSEGVLFVMSMRHETQVTRHAVFLIEIQIDRGVAVVVVVFVAAANVM